MPERMLRLFSYDHSLRPDLEHIYFGFSNLAHHMVATIPAGLERTVALRKLLEAKDAAVRAVVFAE